MCALTTGTNADRNSNCSTRQPVLLALGMSAAQMSPTREEGSQNLPLAVQACARLEYAAWYAAWGGNAQLERSQVACAVGEKASGMQHQLIIRQAGKVACLLQCCTACQTPAKPPPPITPCTHLALVAQGAARHVGHGRAQLVQVVVPVCTSTRQISNRKACGRPVGPGHSSAMPRPTASRPTKQPLPS